MINQQKTSKINRKPIETIQTTIIKVVKLTAVGTIHGAVEGVT